MNNVRKLVKAALLLFAACGCIAAQTRHDRYAVILKDPPVAAQVSSKQALRSAQAENAARQIKLNQSNIRSALATSGAREITSSHVLVNAIYVHATPAQAEQLSLLPGVAFVDRLQPMRLHLNQALDLVRAPAAWSTLGGANSSGTGIKIGILDSGIDHEHAAFRDDSLQFPAGFPKCQEQRGDCQFTSRKVIVARSYVDLLVGDDPRFSRPDDLSPRDRNGHGTAVAMIAAGVSNRGPAAQISGVAPKAFLGNYKIFGSPGVNGNFTTFDVIVRAVEDALADGMDIVNLSLGAPAVWGPKDRGETCNKPGNDPCDWRADAVENATRMGLTVVVSAGNAGDLGTEFPALNSIETPGTAPSAITVGASTNRHIYYQNVQVEGSGVPADLQRINALFTDGPKPGQKLSAPLRDVSKLEDDGLACSPLSNGSLAGAIALIQRGDCALILKVQHAQRAGAIGVILYQREGFEGVFSLAGLQTSGIPSVLVGHKAGLALAARVAANAGTRVALDPTLAPVTTADFNTIADLSSRGPSLREDGVKPELVAVGTDLYVATQKFDPDGAMFDPSGYTAVNGTSFAAPLVAGAAALVKQRNPGFTPAQIKSTVVNTASGDIEDFDSQGRIQAFVQDVGAGKLHVDNAVKTTVTVEPSTISFGVIESALPSRGLTFRNTGRNGVRLELQVRPRVSTQVARVVLSSTSLSIQPGQSSQVTARLEGAKPEPGEYEGIITAEGGGAPLRIPYLFIVPSGVPHSILPLAGSGFSGEVNGFQRLTFKVVDRHGAPVPKLPVTFRSTLGGGIIEKAFPDTDSLGIGEAEAVLGPQIGEQEFLVEAGSLKFYFTGTARPAIAIETGGVLNAASLRNGQGLAPGSYISIYGRGLSESTRAATTPFLPLSIAGVSVSFDQPTKKLSVPGRLHFVSEGQINVQIPWELQGATSAQMKVSIGDSSSALYTVPLLDYSPAAFEYPEASSGRTLTAALDESSGLVGTANPARRGSVVQIYANGLGPVDNQPPSGALSPAQPLSSTRVLPVVTIGGRPAEVLFSGLAPFNVGLYQMNVRVPADAPAGLQPLVITSNGIVSKSANLPIQ